MRFQWLDHPAPRRRKRAQFRATYQRTLQDLDRELEAIQGRARNVILAAGFPPSKIRRDGFPYSGARPEHPAVTLHFEINGQPAAFPCDTFETFEDNLRAIVLSLEALRAVDRYGVTRNQEQYKGWLRLEAAKSDPAEVLRKANRTLGWSADDIRAASKENLHAIYRAAMANVHPDRPGGSHEATVAVQQAYQDLRKQRGFA